MNKQSIEWVCFIHTEFYFSVQQRCSHKHRDRDEDEEEMIQSGGHRAIVTVTVGDITPQSGSAADRICLCLSLALSLQASLHFENALMMMCFTGQI